MNNTKWDELRLAMVQLGALKPQWRTRATGSGHLSGWDGEWFYHFREGGYETIEWVEIKVTSPEQRAGVLAALQLIHVPGEETPQGFQVFGHVPDGVAVAYV